MTEKPYHEFFMFPNALADITHLLHPYLLKVYIALGRLCQMPEKYRDEHGEWSVWTGKHTVRKIAKKAGVRYSSVSRATDIWRELGPIPKRVISITERERIKYVIVPRNHPAFVGLRERAEAMRNRLGKNWGLLPKKVGFPVTPGVTRVPDSRRATPVTPGVAHCLSFLPLKVSQVLGDEASSWGVAHLKEGVGGGRDLPSLAVPGSDQGEHEGGKGEKGYDLDALGCAFQAVWWAVARENAFIARHTWPDDLKRFCKARGLPLEVFLALEGRYRHLGKPPPGAVDLTAEWRL